ncbi:hypothetical protein GQ42DRAFT_10418 [Ramicandelaber brevisporus]|nr:hypothetical protein GQ42DRAFT_10418 [Ramicandelaber brevisporus]
MQRILACYRHSLSPFEQDSGLNPLTKKVRFNLAFFSLKRNFSGPKRMSPFNMQKYYKRQNNNEGNNGNKGNSNGNNEGNDNGLFRTRNGFGWDGQRQPNVSRRQRGQCVFKHAR